MSQRMVNIGCIQRTHGTRGDVVANIENRKNISLKPGQTLSVGPDPDRLETYTIRAIHPMNKDTFITLEEIGNQESAEHILGQGVWVPAEVLKPLETGSFYHYQLIGLTVHTTDGKTIGRITDVMKTGANDVFIVTSGSKEYLIPAISAVVKKIDVSGGIMLIEDMPNMLDLPDGTL
ncbi:16S rRNA processing protein RimM [bacterium]|nr:16S rRNA processing protein RimM [candidate division CSSED10-310 bacterium]